MNNFTPIPVQAKCPNCGNFTDTKINYDEWEHYYYIRCKECGFPAARKSPKIIDEENVAYYFPEWL